jgi:hypothetical protein
VNHWNKIFGKSLLMEFFTNGDLDGKKLTTLIDAGAELHPSERQKVLHLAAMQQNDDVLRIVLNKVHSQKSLFSVALCRRCTSWLTFQNVDKTGAGKPHVEAQNEVCVLSVSVSVSCLV